MLIIHISTWLLKSQYQSITEEGNEGCQGYNHEEWQARDTGGVHGMWD